MSTTMKEVRFGTKQEAVITPKEGYELESVVVKNTADNSVIPSELTKSSNNPPQWVCSFIQPAGHVTIKPVVRPILYSISFEVSDECNIVLVEEDSIADIEIKAAAADDGAEAAKGAEAKEDTKPEGEPEDFKRPQHSSKQEDPAQGSDVGGEAIHTDNEQVIPPNTETVKEDIEEKSEREEDATAPPEEAPVVDDSADQSKGDDVEYDAGDYADELDDGEPIEISQEEYEKKNDIYWRWKEKYDAGECDEKKFRDIQKRHFEFMDKITAGKIVLV